MTQRYGGGIYEHQRILYLQVRKLPRFNIDVNYNQVFELIRTRKKNPLSKEGKTENLAGTSERYSIVIAIYLHIKHRFMPISESTRKGTRKLMLMCNLPYRQKIK